MESEELRENPAERIENLVVGLVDTVSRFFEAALSFSLRPRLASRKAWPLQKSPFCHPVPYCVIMAFFFLLLDSIGFLDLNAPLKPTLASWKENFLLKDISVTRIVLATIPMMIFVLSGIQLAARRLPLDSARGEQFKILVLYACGTQPLLLVIARLIDIYRYLYLNPVFVPPLIIYASFAFRILLFGYTLLLPFFLCRMPKDHGQGYFSKKLALYSVVLSVCCFVIGHFCVLGLKSVSERTGLSLEVAYEQPTFGPKTLEFSMFVTARNNTDRSIFFRPQNLCLNLTTNRANPALFKLRPLRIDLPVGKNADEIHELPAKASFGCSVNSCLPSSEAGINGTNFTEFQYFAQVLLKDLASGETVHSGLTEVQPMWCAPTQ